MLDGERVRVLFISGFGRSGSTILGQVLDGVPGIVHVGELNFLWDHNVLKNRECGCGLPFSECPFWQDVMGRAFGGSDGVDALEMVRLQQLGTRTRHAVEMLAPPSRARLLKRMRPLMEANEQLYRAIREVSGAEVVVDSSKLPPYGFVQSQSAGVDLRCVHLVRDPRAAAYSWSRRSSKTADDGSATGPAGWLPEVGPAHSAITWTIWNVLTELLWRNDRERYLRIRYEDFVAEPRVWSQRVVELAGLPHAALPFVDDRTIEVGVAHTAAGNPNRFNRGAVSIRSDDEWRRRFPRRDQLGVVGLTLPMFARYHYSWGTGRPTPT
ncbi:MAG TPA: sulfotransferase domain-containing protein [Acidimicrobiia bacterium]